MSLWMVLSVTTAGESVPVYCFVCSYARMSRCVDCERVELLQQRNQIPDFCVDDQRSRHDGSNGGCSSARCHGGHRFVPHARAFIKLYSRARRSSDRLVICLFHSFRSHCHNPVPDDLGADDMGFANQNQIKTPTFDAMHEQVLHRRHRPYRTPAPMFVCV